MNHPRSVCFRPCQTSIKGKTCCKTMVVSTFHTSSCLLQDVSTDTECTLCIGRIANPLPQPISSAKCHSPQDAQRPSCSRSRPMLFDSDSLRPRQRHQLLRPHHPHHPRKPRTTSSRSSVHRSVYQTLPNAHSPRSDSCPRHSTFTQKARKRAPTQNCIVQCCIRSRRRVPV